MPILSYGVYWDGLNPGSDSYTELVTLDAQTLDYTHTSVNPGTLYKFYVVATNIVGDSLPSAKVTIRAA